MYFQTHTQLPVGWRREVEGSTPAIRLQRPFVTIQDFPKKNQVKLRCCLKYHAHQLRCMIYLNTHWQSTLGSAAVRETILLAEPPIKDFTDAKIDYSKNKNIMQHFYFLAQFLYKHSRYSTILVVHEYFPRIFCVPICIFVIELTHKCRSKIHANNLPGIRRENGDSSISFVKICTSLARKSNYWCNKK